MGKFSGIIGFVKAVEKEDEPGIYDNVTIERSYKGDILKNYRSIEQSSEKVNADVNISNTFSIVSDSFMNENFSYMKYLVYKGVKWNINSIDIQYPRLNINVGGIYHGKDRQS